MEKKGKKKVGDAGLPGSTAPVLQSHRIDVSIYAGCTLDCARQVGGGESCTFSYGMKSGGSFMMLRHARGNMLRECG